MSNTDDLFEQKIKNLEEDARLSKERLETTQEEVRKNATPEQLALMDEVGALVQAESADLDRRFFEAEQELRTWFTNLLGISLTISEIEDFSTFCKDLKSGSLFIFKPRGGPREFVLYKNAFGTVDKAQSYIQALEKTVIDITNNSQFTPLSFFDLIKLAFKRLFK